MCWHLPTDDVGTPYTLSASFGSGEPAEEILRCAQDDSQDTSQVRSREALSPIVCQPGGSGTFLARSFWWHIGIVGPLRCIGIVGPWGSSRLWCPCRNTCFSRSQA